MFSTLTEDSTLKFMSVCRTMTSVIWSPFDSHAVGKQTLSCMFPLWYSVHHTEHIWKSRCYCSSNPASVGNKSSIHRPQDRGSHVKITDKVNAQPCSAWGFHWPQSQIGFVLTLWQCMPVTPVIGARRQCHHFASSWAYWLQITRSATKISHVGTRNTKRKIICVDLMLCDYMRSTPEPASKYLTITIVHRKCWG